MKGYNYMYNADEHCVTNQLRQFTEQRRMVVLNNIKIQYVVF